MVTNEDINELRRIAVNTYENDKRDQLHRIINGINELLRKNAELTNENLVLKSKSNKKI